jgi:hypothetical protein
MIGKALVLVGTIFILLGVAFIVFGKLPVVGKLPGDILVKKHNFTFYFPLTTSILISVIISAVMILVSYIRK